MMRTRKKGIRGLSIQSTTVPSFLSHMKRVRSLSSTSTFDVTVVLDGTTYTVTAHNFVTIK